MRDELERGGLPPHRDAGDPYRSYDSYHIEDPNDWDLQISNAGS